MVDSDKTDLFGGIVSFDRVYNNGAHETKICLQSCQVVLFETMLINSYPSFIRDIHFGKAAFGDIDFSPIFHRH